MIKDDLMEILQSCLLYFEGEDILSLYGLMNKKNVTIGIKLCEFLKKEVK